MVLESATDRTDDGSTEVGRRVNELEVLATGLADNARVAQVPVNVVADLLPERAEDVGRAGKVETGEHAVREDLVDERDGRVAVRARKELNDVLRETGLEEDVEDEPRGVGRARRRLPDEDVADKSRSTDKVGGDGSEAADRGVSI